MDGQKYMFQNKYISEVICTVWFSHLNSLGMMYQEEFSPIPKATIALVLTTVGVYAIKVRHVKLTRMPLDPPLHRHIH